MKRDELIAEILADVDNLLSVYRNPNMRDHMLQRIRVGAEALCGIEKPHDKGPWSVSSDGRVISSDDFEHDVQLKVSGDFYHDEQRAAYAKCLCDTLNGNRHLATSLPKEPPEALLWSMVARYRHDFGILKDASAGPLVAGVTEQEHAAVLTLMRQLYEEVAGHGFFKYGQ